MGKKTPEIVETTLLRGRVRLLQPKKGFHASIDAVFLAAFAPVRGKMKVLDAGCGVGSAGLCLLSRAPDATLAGIDIQKSLTDLALQNSALNDADGRCRFFAGDIRSDKNIPDNAFTTVIVNPPYLEAGAHVPSPEKSKAVAHGESATLTDWVKYAHKKLKQGGDLAMIHRADRLEDVVAALTARRWFGSVVIFPLFSYAGENAKRILIRARKERYAKTALRPGMILHKKGGAYTDEAEAVLSRAAGIED